MHLSGEQYTAIVQHLLLSPYISTMAHHFVRPRRAHTPYRTAPIAGTNNALKQSRKKHQAVPASLQSALSGGVMRFRALETGGMPRPVASLPSGGGDQTLPESPERPCPAPCTLACLHWPLGTRPTVSHASEQGTGTGSHGVRRGTVQSTAQTDLALLERGLAHIV